MEILKALTIPRLAAYLEDNGASDVTQPLQPGNFLRPVVAPIQQHWENKCSVEEQRGGGISQATYTLFVHPNCERGNPLKEKRKHISPDKAKMPAVPMFTLPCGEDEASIARHMKMK